MRKREKTKLISIRLPVSVIRSIKQMCKETNSTQAVVIASVLSPSRFDYEIRKAIGYHKASVTMFEGMKKLIDQENKKELQRLIDKLMRRDKSKKGRDS